MSREIIKFELNFWYVLKRGGGGGGDKKIKK